MGGDEDSHERERQRSDLGKFLRWAKRQPGTTTRYDPPRRKEVIGSMTAYVRNGYQRLRECGLEIHRKYWKKED